MKSKLRVINAARVVGLFALIAVAILAGAPSANASTYDVNFTIGTTTVTGDIVTTCDSCDVSNANITSWMFSWQDSSNSSFKGSASGITNGGFGTVLLAGSGFIQFGSNPGSFETFSDAPSQVSFGEAHPETCANPVTDCIVIQDADFSREFAHVTQPFTIATEEVVTTTPLPAALPLFATGLGGLGLLGWRRRRKAAVIAA
jgi:hypothetical protein